MGLPGFDHIESRRALGLVVAAWIVLGALLLDPGGYSPFGPAKWLAISALLFGASAISLGEKVVVHSTAMKLWALLIGWSIVAAVLGVDKFHAWIGTPTRRFGVVGWILCALAFVVGHQLVLRRQSHLVYKALIMTGLGIGLYAVLEAFGAAPVDLVDFSTRLGSTYGSPAYVGAASALLFPMLVGLTTAFDNRWRSAAYLSATLMLFTCLASGTRAAWVGLAVAALSVLVVARRVIALRPNLILLTLFGFVVAVLVTPVGTRLADAANFSDGTSRGRIAEWTVGLAAVAERPFSGAGPEGYRVVFGEVVSESYAQTYGRNVLVDRTHNGLIDIAATIGIPGLLVMVGLLVVMGRVVLTAFKSRDPVLVGTAAALLAYFTQQQFLFPIVEVDPLAWLLAGMLVVRVADADDMAAWRPSSRKAAAPFKAVLALVCVATLGFGLADVLADRAAGEALEAAADGNFSKADNLANRAVALRPDSSNYAAVGAEVSRLNGLDSRFETALEFNTRGLRFSPQDPGLLAGRGALLIGRARLEGTVETATAAVEHWQGLVATDPNNGRFHLQLGAAYATAGSFETAEEAWIRSAELSPRSTSPLINLANYYLASGRQLEAQQVLLRATDIDPENQLVQDLNAQLAEGS